MKKVEPEKRGSLTGKLFRRLLRASRGFQESLGLQEGPVHVSVPRDGYYNDQRELRIALLEAERRKAEALEYSRRHIVC